MIRGIVKHIDKNIATIELDSLKLKQGDKVSIRVGYPRTPQQNRLYWAYLNYMIDECDLKDKGFFCAQALHESLKAYFLTEKIMDAGEFKNLSEKSTTDLSKKAFMAYLEKVDAFISDFFGVDTSQFWQEMYLS